MSRDARGMYDGGIRKYLDEIAKGLLSVDHSRDSAREILPQILDATIRIVGANAGNIQLLGGDGALRIAAQVGFEKPFLEFFETVSDTNSACGSALKSGARIIVEDVANDPIFREREAGMVMLGAGARAVQSTPILSNSGAIIGMISTHYSTPVRPSERDLMMVDILAGLIPSFLDPA